MLNRKAALSAGLSAAVLFTVVALILVYTIRAETASDVGSAMSNASEVCAGPKENRSTCAGNVFPLASFFRRKGVVALAIIAGIVLVIIGAVLKKG